MPNRVVAVRPRGLAAANRGGWTAAALVAALASCTSGAPAGSGGEDETGGTEAGGAGGKGQGGRTTSGSGGRGGSAAGGTVTTPDAAAGEGGSGGSPATGGSGGDAVDAAVPDSGGGGSGAGGAPACGAAGQACCPGNMCMAPAMPSTMGGGEPGGMVVLELKASGGDPYKYFASKDLLPIDGPDSGYITDLGTSFQFVLHENGAEETVSSGAQRQRNELTVNPGNPAIYKGMHGDTMSYTWRFRLDKMNANPTWCDIFQVKQHGTLGPAPFMALEADKGNLNIDTQRLGVVKGIPLSTILGVWINASVTAKYSETGSLSVSLKKDDGTEVLSYSNNNINLWGAGLDFVRPKWGFYRNKRAGAGEAQIQYNDMKIIRGTVGSSASCSCRN